MSIARISIILPFRDARRTLAAAIASILWQSFEDFLLVLVDDGSADGSVAAARSFDDPRIVLIGDDARRGLPARLNEAVAWAANRSPLIARMDADDIAHPRRLERQLDLLDGDPTIDLVGAGSVVIEGLDRIVGCRRPPADHASICRTPYRKFPLAHPTWLGRTRWFQRHRYDELAARSQDYHLLRDAFATSRFANVPELLLAYNEGERRLAKAIGARVACARNLWRRGVPARELPQAVVGSVGLLAGSLADVAIGVTGRPGLGGLRLRPTTEAEAAEWRALLHRVRRAADGIGAGRDAAAEPRRRPAATAGRM